MIPTIIAIDPSMHSLGLATCTASGQIIATYHIGDVLTPTTHATHDDWRAHAFGMAEAVGNLIRVVLPQAKHKPAENHVVIETPIVFQVQRGQASLQAGDIQKLYFTCGAIIPILAALPSITSINAVTPNDWKGQTPKEIVKRRCHTLTAKQGYLPNTPHLSLDTIEAIMIGQFAIQKLYNIEETGVWDFHAPVTPIYRIAHHYSRRLSITSY